MRRGTDLPAAPFTELSGAIPLRGGTFIQLSRSGNTPDLDPRQPSHYGGFQLVTPTTLTRGYPAPGHGVPGCSGVHDRYEDGDDVVFGTLDQSLPATEKPVLAAARTMRTPRGVRRPAEPRDPILTEKAAADMPSVPKHAQVRAYLTGLIDAELSAGDPIPSERALATRFGVARMTVRHAVDRLVAEGRLRRMRPVGTFVTARPEDISLGSGTVIEALEARGRRHRYRVIGRYTIDASEDVASALGLGVGARVHVVRRVRLAGEDPLAVESVHIPVTLDPVGPRLADYAVDDVLRQRYGVVVDKVEQVVEAVVLQSGSARVLDVPELSPALTLRRRSFAQGTPVAFSISTFRADRCRLHVDPPAMVPL